MNIFIGHATAAVFWLTASQDQCEQARKTNLKPSELSTRELREIPLALQSFFPWAKTLHVIVPKLHRISDIEGVTPHANAVFAPRAFLRLNKGVYIASPEQTFIQMASIFTLHQLVLFGFEICGRYVRNDFSPTGLDSREPICTPNRLKSAVQHAGKFKGRSNAHKALRFIYADAKSPKEVETAARFALCRQYGGDGLPPFKCNYRIDIPKAYRHLTEKPYIEADFCWPNKKIAVEYDSDLHTGSEKIAKDTMRRNILVAQGYKVIGITRIQNSNQREMDRVADEVAIALEIRHDIRTPKYYKEKQALTNAIKGWLRPSPAEYFDNLQTL